MKYNIRNVQDLSTLSAKEQQQIVHANTHGTLFTRGFQQTVATMWRRMCEQQQREYMRVRLRGKRFASIYLDLEPTKRQFSTVTQDRLYHLGKLASEDFVLVGKDHLFVGKVPKEKIEWMVELIRYISNVDAQSQRSINIQTPKNVACGSSTNDPVRSNSL